jgi:hypothetical protein
MLFAILRQSISLFHETIVWRFSNVPSRRRFGGGIFNLTERSQIFAELGVDARRPLI